MSFLSVFIVALVLAVDAFAVAVSNGISIPNFKFKHALKMGLFFGFFQAVMPLLGWFLGSAFKSTIDNIDHWVAFVLLVLIGGKMVFDTFKKDDNFSENISLKNQLSTKLLIAQAIATSIDALAVGVSFALLNVNIYFSSLIIGVVALILSVMGGLLGKKIGTVFKNKAQLFGGVILIVIGLKILLEHITILNL